MKPLAAIDVPEDADPAGRHEVVIMPVSHTKAIEKGAIQGALGVLGGIVTILTALWFDPTVGATITATISAHPEWALYYALANVLFGYLRNLIAHKSPESRAAIVESVRGGLR